MHTEDHPKIYTKPQTANNEISIGIRCCLKHDRDTGRKAVLGDVKTAFTWVYPQFNCEKGCYNPSNIFA